MSVLNYIRVTILMVMFICLGVGCINNIYQKEKNQYEFAISKIEFSDTIEWIVVLPGFGCHACLEFAEEFMKTNINSRRVLFVLTDISSIKELELKVKLKIIDHSNVFVDSENSFYLKSKNQVYPCIIHLEKGKIIDHEFSNPQNKQAFPRLEQKLKDEK